MSIWNTSSRLSNNFYQFIKFAFSLSKYTIATCTWRSFLWCVRHEAAWCTHTIAIPNSSSRYEVLNWIFHYIFSWVWSKFFTKTLYARVCRLASDSITYCLSCGYIFSFLTCWLWTCRTSFFDAQFFQGITAVVIRFLISTENKLLITSCSISSLMFVI